MTSYLGSESDSFPSSTSSLSSDPKLKLLAAPPYDSPLEKMSHYDSSPLEKVTHYDSPRHVSAT